MAPPFTFRRSAGMPSLSRQYSTCTAKASFSSPQVDVLHPEAQLLQHLGHGKHGANAHFVRLATGHRKAEEAAQGLEALLAGVLFAGDHAGARAIENWLALPAEIKPPGSASAGR